MFSEQDVKDSTLIRCVKVYHSGVFDHWDIGIRDIDKFEYYWQDNTTVEDATAEQIAQAIGDYLMANVEKKILMIAEYPYSDPDSVQSFLNNYSQTE